VVLLHPSAVAEPPLAPPDEAPDPRVNVEFWTRASASVAFFATGFLVTGFLVTGFFGTGLEVSLMFPTSVPSARFDTSQVFQLTTS